MDSGEDIAAGEEVLAVDIAAEEGIREDGNKEILWLQRLKKLKKYLEKIW